MNALTRSALVAVLCARVAAAATGVCDSNPPTTTQACIDAIQNSGGVVNDIFRDSNGRRADQLPAFAKLVSAFATCATANTAGCNGTSNAPYDCPGQYTCDQTDMSLAAVGAVVNLLDRNWGHPCRLTDHALVNGCPNWAACTADGVGGNYIPWEGLVFDLGGPSNQVAIFAENDHGPQPCESAEYTVFLTNDPAAREIVLHPTTTGADPAKWNRAVLKKVYTKGFVEVRTPDPAGHEACGDTSLYSVEEDSMVTVYGLPCSINFRYAAIVAGNDGLDFPACQFHSSESELDAVAGLTEQGAGVCPDADHDGYADCSCSGAPPICDCNDANPDIHPNAPEACDSPVDLNCNKRAETCAVGFGCYGSVCIRECANDEFSSCPAGATCATTDAGQNLCVPDNCTAGGCPPGSVCDSVTQRCRGACDSSVVCPKGQRCVSGDCIDPCRSIVCAAGSTCVDGACTPPCSCFSGDVGCTGGNKCDRPTGSGGTDQCVAPTCVGVSCGFGQHCAAGTCVGLCTGVQCPANQVCVPPVAGVDAGFGCQNLCANVQCSLSSKCDFATGKCVAIAIDAGVDAGSGGGTDAGTGGQGDSGVMTSDAGRGDGGPGSIIAKGTGCGCGQLGVPEGLLALWAALIVLGHRARRWR